MKIKSGFLVRCVGGENVAVPIGERANTFHGMVKLNETALELWNFFLEEHTQEDAVCFLMEKYRAEEATVLEGVRKFLETLERYGMLA